MLSPSQSLQYQKESVERALTCANNPMTAFINRALMEVRQ
ncbi:hypothetical protein IGF74_003445 [Escherichia coli]|nr:hypothetical protein [Escherichia coli]